ncbi:unnamed protein product [Allacma fusca]|uniref:Protein unc-80 homolog n=1 Tax=Allacma fusca TaxID=39272 RepID=A0A8J2PH78_9HEXA|nr:unnamed protein product [Allacma fusca]
MMTPEDPVEHQDEEFAVPIPIQTFLWRQTCPFIRPRLGKLHEATCVFCQSPTTHHEIREACKALEKVLVQNILFGLSPSLTEAIKSIPRWRMIQTSFPHVMHCTAQLLTNRKLSGIQSGLGSSETKLLYTLHWILLDCAEECADADFEKGIIPSSPFYYVFPISAVTLFVYLFAPLCNQLKPSDFNNFRLENGYRIWPAMWSYKSPDPLCFTCPVKPKQPLNPFFVRKNKKELFGDVFVGGMKQGFQGAETRSFTEAGGIETGISTPPPTPEHAKTEYSTNLVLEEELEKLALPAGSGTSGAPFPETIPEESSSNDEEHVMIFRLGSIPESDGIREGTIFKMSVRQSSNESSKTSPSEKSKERKGSAEFRPRTDSSPRTSIGRRTPASGSVNQGQIGGKTVKSTAAPPQPTWQNQKLATFMDVAVLRCMFITHWEEEGVFWAVSYLLKRLEEVASLKEAMKNEKDEAQRQRSNSLPAPKSRTSYLSELAGARLIAEKDRSKLRTTSSTKGRSSGKGDGSQFFSFSACSSPTSERRQRPGSQRRGSEKGSKKKLTMFDLKTFVETKLLSKSEKMLEKIGALEKAVANLSEEQQQQESEQFPRPQSALDHMNELEKKVETMGESYFGGESNLFKGKSMPSLSCLLVDELAAPTGYVGVTNYSVEKKPERNFFPNPIITVTEHTPAPTPSPDRIRVSSLESQLNSILHQFVQEKRDSTSRPKLVRSHSDTNISYSVSEAAEAPGTSQYIKHNGEINVKVVFKALHHVCSREIATKSVRVCQVVLQLMELLMDQVEKDEDIALSLDSLTRVISCMGCIHGCGEAQRCNQSDTVRSHANNLLLRLAQKFRRQFAAFYQNFIMFQNISTIMDFFHSLCGFCVDPSTLLSPLSKTDPKVKDFYASYVTGMEYTHSKVECHIFKAVFKKLVSRLVNMSKELRSSENMALYCDVRQLICYIYENDGNTFRKVALSALIDSAEIGSKNHGAQNQTTRVVRRAQQLEDSQNFYVMDETGPTDRGPPSAGNNNKKGFFKKKSSSSTCASMGDNENTGESPSGTLTRKHATLTPKSSELDLVNRKISAPKKSLVSWLTKGSGGDKSFDFDMDDSGGAEATTKSTRRQATIVQKAKRRVEERLKRMKIKRDSTNDETTAGGLSRRGSFENINNENVVGESSEFVVLKERRLVNRTTVRDGLLRFGFLLEITLPGSLPDAHLMAALLDLPQTVVAARACIILECCYLVHACNRGHWPLWMKLPVFRPSCAGINKNTGTRSKSYGLQKAAGKMFQQWGEAINSRLEEYMKSNRSKIAEMDLTDEAKQKELAQMDEDEDFLDEASITDGFDCPMALQILACMLLFEITAFLRETYQSLPKSGVVGKMTTTEKESKPPTTGGGGGTRRWSYVKIRLKLIGLSSMGQSQASHSLQSISDPHAPPAGGERKISFVLNDNESNESNEKDKAHQAAQANNAEDDDKKGKKVRPLLLRRGTPGGGSSFRRRSIKLQRSGKKDQDGDCEHSMKRSDSLTSGKRKVSSISDDTSEQNSGEESPGVMSNEDNINDDDSIYMPWLNTIIEFLGTLNFRCIHQGFCHPQCPRRLMRGVSRLLKAVRKIYGEEFGIGSSDMTHLGMEKTSLTNENLGASKEPKEKTEESLIIKYIRNHVQGGFHSMFSTLMKAASILSEDQFLSLLPTTWELLIEPDIQVSSGCAALFILAGIKAPEQVKNLMQADFEHPNPATRMNALLRFQTLWRCRHQVWPRMEENSTFKAPPPGIEFTLPSPRIGVECIPVVDPPWTPQTKAKVEEVTLNQDKPHVSRRYLVTATKTRKTQQAELVKMALQAEEDKKRCEREQFLITTVPITSLASYEPSSHHSVGEDEADDETQNQEKATQQAAQQGTGLTTNLTAGQGNQGNMENAPISTSLLISKSSHHKGVTLFPSSLCSAAIYIIQLLDDPAVTLDGNAVYEVAYQVLWHCLVEDSSLFLRYILEKLTRGKHELMFKVLRHLIMFVPRLPQQAAFSLYNHIIGFIMFHTRSPQDTSSEMIGSALSVLWMVVHSVQGIMFKDLKQILRKEQCDASILLTANVPAAKKIVVHGPMGPEAGGIPTQFPVQEDTQFIQILRESLDFFSIDEEHHKEYFLVDHKTHQIHSPNAYVRDFYFFSRSQHPQLSLAHMAPDHAYNALQRQAFILKFLESGKVTLTWAILKNVDQVMQRVVFLHEELMKLPSFPRKALESDMDITKGGMMGRELLGLDVLHKFMWAKLITRMFEAMSGNFAYSGDIHLFINVLSGALMVHSEDATIIRYVTAAFINAAQQFKNIFSTNGYLLVMPPLLLTYCNHQSNPLVTGSVEFACKEFYLLHRKPFVLQMFGALAALLDTDEQAQYGDPRRVPSKCLFRLLLSLETPTPDPLHITELIHGPQPLRPLDFCYHDDSDEITVLDCISMCVCVVAYASDSLRGQQMLTILEAVLPPYLTHIQTNKTEGKTERDVINHIAVALKTLVNNCEPLAKNYSGPQMSEAADMRGSSQRNYASKGGLMTPGYEFADDDSHSKYMSDHSRNKSAYDRDMQDSEVIRDEFRRPRDTLLSLVSDFYSKSFARLMELAKKGGADAKPVELLDSKSHVRLSEVAMSLLKVSPYDPATMGCRGLQRYMVEVFPFGDWAHESARPALIAFLRRVDKTFIKICKKTSIRRHTDWEAAAGLLKGIYQTLWRHPYIVHMQHLKSLIQTCQCLLMGEGQASELGLSSAGAALLGKIPPTHFCSTVVRLLALQVRALGETYSLEQACGIQPSVPSLQDKSDVLLMNLLLPMCLRVGSGRKDVPKMRKSDIVYILNVILNSMNAGGPRIKSASEANSTSVGTGGVGTGATRSGSVTERKLKLSTCQIAFLGLKILCVCFDTELSSEWPRTVRAIQELGHRGEGGAPLWDFLEFVVTVRTSIFPMFCPLIAQKMAKTPSNDQERGFQFAIREKLRSITLGRCKGSLLVDLAHQMKQLKEELETRKEETIISKKNLNLESSENRRPRPSLSELFPGLAARFGGSDESKGSTTTINRGLNRESSVRVKPSSQGRMVDRFMRRVSIAGDAPFTIPENSILKAKERSEETFELHPERSELQETSYAAEEDVPKQHRLQRQKFQSRKTFRFRKSRRGNLEFSSVDMEEENQRPDSPSSPSPKDELIRKEQMDDERSIDSTKSDKPQKASLKIRSKKRKTSTSPQNGADCESQNSFSRTSSTCGYRESFGSVERYSLQMLERLEVTPPDDDHGEKPGRSGTRKRGERGGPDDEDTLI